MESYPFPELAVDLVETSDDPTNSGRLLSSSSASQSMSLHAISSPLLDNNANTPAESVLSIHYQSSDYSNFDADDQLFDGFFVSGNTSTLLSQDADFDLFAQADPISVAASAAAASANSHTFTTSEDLAASLKPTYPISPDQTPSLNAPSSPEQRAGGASLGSGFRFTTRDIPSIAGFEGLVSPEQLTKAAPETSGIVPFSELQAFVVRDINTQLTPDTTSSGDSQGVNDNSISTDGGTTTTTAPPMTSPNPHVTVSVWGKDGVSHEESYPSATSEIRTERADSADGRRGIDPANRPSTEIASTINQDAEARKVEEKNSAVSEWLSTADTSEPSELRPSAGAEHAFEGVPTRFIDARDETENAAKDGGIYIEGNGGEITDVDYDIVLKNRGWGSGPSVRPIVTLVAKPDRHQPESSQAAIERFERMYHDNASMVSRAATWGTRRRSLPSIADIEGVTSGNFLKRLSIRRDPHSRRPSIIKNLRTLVGMPSTSQQNKRTRAPADDDASSYIEESTAAYSPDGPRHDSTTTTKPTGPPRTGSWGRNKQQVPSINTALFNVGSNLASIGSAAHARSGSIGGNARFSPPLTSPKSGPLLDVRLRPRSKSDVKGRPDIEHPNILKMLRESGGPPVASLPLANPVSTFPGTTSTPFGSAAAAAHATRAAANDLDDDDDDDDELLEDGDLRAESDELIDRITPDLAGFKELVLGLNPMLETTNTYLVERIAYQQIARYKGLLNNKVKHLGLVNGKLCSNGPLCVGQGGEAVLCDSRGAPRSLDPLSTTYGGGDMDDTTSPLDGAITSDSFPKYIPVPPTSTLPAEFECQLCFQKKRPLKPSDWTKHVHEDVQPFTCTWDRCRDPKIFKRKADWVRHENEGHRHLEWWTCDVDECRHTCYRRDNFLKHLTREHKFSEPKHMTKAAIKRSGIIDPTWQRVEGCHAETKERPQSEPCRFCGKTFPTWKKLTVHLAKHMEHISLPILRLVEQKEVEPDTLISPVQDPPPRTFAPAPTLPLSGDPLHGGLAGYPSNMMNNGQGAGVRTGSVAGFAMGYGQGTAPDAGSFLYPPTTQVQYPQQPYYAQQPFHAAANTIPSPMQSLDAAAIGHQTYAGLGDLGSLGVTAGDYLSANASQYIADPSYAGFPTTTSTNALGLQPPLVASQLHYDATIDPSIGSTGEHYTPQGSVMHGSVSPFAHSPHQPQGQFYGQ